MGRVDGAPAGLCGLDELERHGDAGGPRARALGDPLPEPDGGEGRLDRVGGAQVDPVLGGVVVERQQHVEVVGDLRDGLGPLGAVVGLERLGRLAGRGPCPRRCRSPPARPSRPGAPTWAARQGRCQLRGTSSAARGCRGTPRAAPSRTPAPRHRPRAPAPASRGACSRAAGRPTTRLTRGTRRPARPAPCVPSARTPIITSRHTLSCSRRTLRWIPSTHRYT